VFRLLINLLYEGNVEGKVTRGVEYESPANDHIYVLPHYLNQSDLHDIYSAAVSKFMPLSNPIRPPPS
jgi:hypothetical protein